MVGRAGQSLATAITMLGGGGDVGLIGVCVGGGGGCRGGTCNNAYQAHLTACRHIICLPPLPAPPACRHILSLPPCLPPCPCVPVAPSRVFSGWQLGTTSLASGSLQGGHGRGSLGALGGGGGWGVRVCVAMCWPGASGRAAPWGRTCRLLCHAC